MFRKLFFVQLVAVMLILSAFVTNIMAQTGASSPIITIDTIIGAITPLIIFGVTWLVKKIKPTLMGWNVVWVVIPILSLIATSILTLIDQAASFWSQLLWNFLSVAVAQLIIQLGEAKRLQNTSAKNKLLTSK